MPSLGADMEKGTVLEWHVAPGDEVHKGDIIAVVDTEKSDIEVEVFESGVVTEILVPVGTEVEVGTPLAMIEAAEARSGSRLSRQGVTIGSQNEEKRVHSPVLRSLAARLGVDLDDLSGSGPGGAVTRADVERAAAGQAGPTPAAPGGVHARPEPATPAPTPAAPTPAPAPTPMPTSRAPHQRVPSSRRSSPLARRRAAERGVDLSSLQGSGPGGAVKLRDVEAAKPAERDRTAATRRATGALMARSKREIPHYYLSTTIDLRQALDWMDEANRERPVTERLLVAALLLKATALATRQVPRLNGWWTADDLVVAERVDLGVGVSLRGGGLVSPVIPGADEMDLATLMARLRDIVGRARAGKLRASDMTEASLTVTNLGDQGVDSVYGVIAPPQVAVVGFGAANERPWAVSGMLEVRPLVTATLSADHRATDGHEGARFLSTIDRLLQEPEKL